jgi:hypothetical protein
VVLMLEPDLCLNPFSALGGHRRVSPWHSARKIGRV